MLTAMDDAYFDRQSLYDTSLNSDDACSMNGLSKQTTRNEAEPRKRSCELENDNPRIEKKTKLREKYVAKAWYVVSHDKLTHDATLSVFFISKSYLLEIAT
jgi:hypothetical protein